MGTVRAVGVEAEKGTSVEKLDVVPARRTAAEEVGAAEKRPAKEGHCLGLRSACLLLREKNLDERAWPQIIVSG